MKYFLWIALWAFGFLMTDTPELRFIMLFLVAPILVVTFVVDYADEHTIYRPWR